MKGHEKSAIGNKYIWKKINAVDNVLQSHTDIVCARVISGQYEFYVNHHSFVASEGDFVVLNMGDNYRYNESIRNSSIEKIYFPHTLLGPVFDKIKCLSNIIPGEDLEKFGLTDFSHEIFGRIKNELVHKFRMNREAVSSLLTGFWVIMSRNFRDDFEGAVNIRNMVPVADFKNVLEYIDKNYSEELSVEEIARIVGYSTDYFLKLFSEQMGKSLNTYINEVRCEKAIKRLLSSRDSISNIALECGFTSLRTFNRVFKTVTGLTPSEVTRSNFLLQDKIVIEDENLGVRYVIV